jgi:hypothetical protein
MMSECSDGTRSAPPCRRAEERTGAEAAFIEQRDGLRRNDRVEARRDRSRFCEPMLCTRTPFGGSVIPANAGIQVGRWGRKLDSRVRGNDDSQFSGLYVQSRVS